MSASAISASCISRSPLLSNFSLTSIGQPDALQSQVQFPGPPVMLISGFDPSGIFSSVGADSTINNATDDYRISGNLSRFIGNHSLTFGGEFLRATFNYAQNNSSAGSYNFNNNFTAQNPLMESAAWGWPLFCSGYPSGGSMSQVIPLAAEQLYPALYANDDWRMSHKLTLHLGLRWEDTRPFTERHDRLSYFDPNQINPGAPPLPGSAICLEQ